VTVGMSTTTVLGIDPGSRVTGLGIVASKGSQLQHCYSASIRTGDGSLGERLAVIYSAVSDAITRYRPDSIAIEQVFVSKKSAFGPSAGSCSRQCGACGGSSSTADGRVQCA